MFIKSKLEEPKKSIVKKSLRWAENLESVSEKAENYRPNISSLGYGVNGVTSSPSLDVLIERQFDEDDKVEPPASSSSRKMRRSYSTSDMNKYLMSRGVGDVDDADADATYDDASSSLTARTAADSSASSTMILQASGSTLDGSNVQNQSDELMHLNLTYDKTATGTGGSNILMPPVIANPMRISPSKVVNSSFMETSSILASSSSSSSTSAANNLPLNLQWEKV